MAARCARAHREDSARARKKPSGASVKVFGQAFFKKLAGCRAQFAGGKRPAPTEPAGETRALRPCPYRRAAHEKKLGKQRSVFPERRRTEKVASRKLGCGPAPRTIPCPPPSLIPKDGTRLGRGDRKARCENLCRLWRHGGPPARVLHLKMSHRDIFSLSCACWRYKTVGRCPTPCQLSFEKAGQRTSPAYGAHVR